MAKNKVVTIYTGDIAEQVGKILQLTKSDAKLYTETVINTIVEELIAGHKVNLQALPTPHPTPALSD